MRTFQEVTVKLRSIKLNDFREGGSIVVDLSAGGVPVAAGDPTTIRAALRFASTGELPEHGSVVARLIGNALRFALAGDLPEDGSVIADGATFAWVDVGLGLEDDEHVSVFRGLGSAGTMHASLREGGGQRVTRGVDEVNARLAELLDGSPVERLAALLCEPAVHDPHAEPMGDAPRPGGGRTNAAAEPDAVDGEIDGGETDGTPPAPLDHEPPRADLGAAWAVAALASILVAALVFFSVGPVRAGAGLQLALAAVALGAVAGSLTLTSRRLRLRDRIRRLV